MAALTYVATGLLMAVFLVAVVGAVIRGRHWQGYRPHLAADGPEFARLSAMAGSTATWTAAFLLLIAVTAGGALVIIGGVPVSAGAQAAAVAAVAVAAGAALAFYLFYGTYRAARARGLRRAAAVFAGSWVLGLAGIAAVVAKLLS